MSSFLINTRLNNIQRQLNNTADNPATVALDMDGKDILNAGTINYTFLNPPVAGAESLAQTLTVGNDAAGQNITGVGALTCNTLNYTTLNPAIVIPPTPTLTQVLTAGNNAGALNITNLNNIGAVSANIPTIGVTSLNDTTGQPFLTFDNNVGPPANDAVTFYTNINLQTNTIYIADGAGALSFVRQGSPLGPNFPMLTLNTTSDRMTLTGDFVFDNSRSSQLFIRALNASGLTIVDASGVQYMRFNTEAISGTAGGRVVMGVPISGGARFLGTIAVNLSVNTTLDFSAPLYFNIYQFNLTSTSASPITVNFTNPGIQRRWEVRLNALAGDINFTDIGLTVTPADVGKNILFWTNGSGTISKVTYM